MDRCRAPGRAGDMTPERLVEADQGIERIERVPRSRPESAPGAACQAARADPPAAALR